ncbi:MAG: hypothetical protein KW788_01395 [Candidatus Doudnabacteria bacterium]|nr:hypothetical protein [Candidatus Doudnabacteria bacterium]
MFNRVSSLILGILLFLVFYGSTQSLYVFATGLVLFIAATFAINIKRVGVSWPHLLLPCFYLLGSGSIFAVIASPSARLWFLIAACAIFYFLEMQLGRESHFLQNVFLFSAFAIFTGIFSLQFYFPRLSFVWVVLLVFVFSYLLIIQGFAGFSLPVKKYFSFLIALVCAQAAWGLSLWPTYYIVNAIVAFSIFYLLWIFSFSAFFGKLTRNKIYLQLSLVIIVLAATLLSANFLPHNR